MTLKEAIKNVKEVLGMSLDWDDKHYEALEIALDVMTEKQAEVTQKVIVFNRLKSAIKLAKMNGG